MQSARGRLAGGHGPNARSRRPPGASAYLRRRQHGGRMVPVSCVAQACTPPTCLCEWNDVSRARPDHWQAQPGRRRTVATLPRAASRQATAAGAKHHHCPRQAFGPPCSLRPDHARSLTSQGRVRAWSICSAPAGVRASWCRGVPPPLPAAKRRKGRRAQVLRHGAAPQGARRGVVGAGAALRRCRDAADASPGRARRQTGWAVYHRPLPRYAPQALQPPARLCYRRPPSNRSMRTPGPCQEARGGEGPSSVARDGPAFPHYASAWQALVLSGPRLGALPCSPLSPASSLPRTPRQLSRGLGRALQWRPGSPQGYRPTRL